MHEIPVANVVAINDTPVATGVTVVPHVPDVDDSLAFLTSELGLPLGLAERVLDSCAEFEERIWIIDNSGSMSTCDGHRLCARPASGAPFLATCSRWEELTASIEWHARVAARLRSPTTFLCLNPPGRGAAREVRVGLGDPDAELAATRALLASGPTGRTPLVAAMRDAVSRVAARAAELRARGRRVALVIASDGQATDGDVEAAMRPLRDLPVWTVVRLCTDDDAVVAYWNGIDEELELDMDVLDDLRGEAAEVRGGNPWLTYAPELHRVREWGTSEKLIDLLDEKALTVCEIREFAGLLLGRELAAALPHPHADRGAFVAKLARALAAAKPVWDPLRERTRAWMSADKIRAAARREARRDARAKHVGGCVIA